MKVTNQRDPLLPTVKRPAPSSAGQGRMFASLIDGNTARTAEASRIAAPKAVDNLLLVETSTEAPNRSKQAIENGAELLDRLDDIRLGLLTGAIPRDRLATLADMLSREREVVKDRRLKAILDEIDLRVRVELAKLGIAL